MAFPSLLDQKMQEDYYEKIVERYLRFCAEHSSDLDTAWASLHTNASSDSATNPPTSLPIRSKSAGNLGDSKVSISPVKSTGTVAIGNTISEESKLTASSSAELSTLLLSLRKLREAILATASQRTLKFARRVHVFSIRLSILARHPPSYFPSLRYLLNRLHSVSNPLSKPELTEFTSYLILDYACRQNQIALAWEVLIQARTIQDFQSVNVERTVLALTHSNWVLFWETRRNVDGYMRAMMTWAADDVRRTALKAIGRSYLQVNMHWLVGTTTGDEGWTWEQLAQQEKLGWLREGDTIYIKTVKKKGPTPEASNVTKDQTRFSAGTS
jgi:hypothetical protein